MIGDSNDSIRLRVEEVFRKWEANNEESGEKLSESTDSKVEIAKLLIGVIANNEATLDQRAIKVERFNDRN